MSAPYAPDGYTTVTPYLSIKGAQDLLDFLVAVFEAETVDRVVDPDGMLTHASVRNGDSHVELAEASEK